MNLWVTFDKILHLFVHFVIICSSDAKQESSTVRPSMPTSIFLPQNPHVRVLDTKSVEGKKREVCDEEFVEKSVQIEKPSEDEELQQIFVHETRRPSFESFVERKLVDFQLLFLSIFGDFILMVTKVGNSDHAFDHEDDDVVCISWIEAPKTASDVFCHSFEIFRWKLKCWKKKLFLDYFESFHRFFVSFSAEIDPKSTQTSEIFTYKAFQ
jgi:hypothetical protein